MDKRTVVVVCAVVASACATAAAVAAGDKRGHGSERCRVSTFSSTTFEQALEAKETDWFRKKLRCDKASFLLIYRAIYAACPQKPAANAKHKLIKRVALVMYYLAQGGQMDQAGMPLGISHTRSVVYINEMLDVLCSMATRYICMPTEQELESVELGLEAVTGFPNVVGAIDGTLKVPIQRPKDFEGWYCRKMFPAVNVQAVVDHVGSFRSLSICAGSNNDQSLWNGSAVKKRLSTYVPAGRHLLGDAGYKLWNHLLTPYPESEAVTDRRKRVYNGAHSRTRIAVECAFGRLKNRFRILLSKLQQKTSRGVCRVIVASAVLHNLLILVQDSQRIDGRDPLLVDAPRVVHEDATDPELPISHAQGVAKRNDIADILIGKF